MSLAITEAWIRDRVQLEDENLEDVRSLALPGTYHEKITQLGNALHHFTRLKELDLSRNALEYLDGLQHLSLLESLNLYYNNIGILNEVHKLRFNSKLQELDLRLNPVARNEPDYRLFAIHMLPNLRRLDDRGVRDQERKAALMHFGSDQAAEFSSGRHSASYPASSKGDIPREHVPRAEYVAKLSAVPPIETDDSLLIDLAQRMDAPRQNGGSRGSENYHRRELLQMEREIMPNLDHAMENMSNSNANSHHSSFAGVIDQYYPSLKGSSKQHSPLGGQPRSSSDHGSLRGTPPASLLGLGSRDSPSLRNPIINSGAKVRPTDTQAQAVLSRLCDLVDRYWNGSRSLHTHPKFTPTALDILADLPGNDDREKKTEKVSSHVVFDLEKEVDDLRLRLRRIETENERLREEKRSDRKTTVDAHGQESIPDIERDNERLRTEVNTMRVKLRAFEQTNELANMLRESHKALVETNDQLMRELSDARSHSKSGNSWHGGPYVPEKASGSRMDN